MPGKPLAYNLSCVVQSMYNREVEPNFYPADNRLCEA